MSQGLTLHWKHFHFKTGKNDDNFNLTVGISLSGNDAYKRRASQTRQTFKKVHFLIMEEQIKKKDRKKEIEKKTLTEAIMLIQCYYCFSICLVFLHMFSVSHMFSKHKENKFIILFFDDTILCNKSIDILTY